MSGHDEATATLKRRAARLARPPDEVEAGPVRELLVVQVDARRFGVDVARVQRILANRGLCRLPANCGDLLGLMHATEAVVPVADLASVLGGSRRDDRPLVVVVTGDFPAMGFLVDAAEDVAWISECDIVPRSQPTSEAGGAEQAIAPNGLVVLDADALLTDPRLTARDPHPGSGIVHSHLE